jgi:hypothetical protein
VKASTVAPLASSAENGTFRAVFPECPTPPASTPAAASQSIGVVPCQR